MRKEKKILLLVILIIIFTIMSIFFKRLKTYEENKVENKKIENFKEIGNKEDLTEDLLLENQVL